MAKTSEKEFWKYIKEANWKKDGDYERIQKYFSTLDPEKLKKLEIFCRNKQSGLYTKYEKDWLDRIPVSDDGWDDLTAEVVGRGEEFYKTITVEKLQKMAEKRDYTENFMYCFHLNT